MIAAKGSVPYNPPLLTSSSTQSTRIPMLARHLRTSRLALRPYRFSITNVPKSFGARYSVARPNESATEQAARLAKEKWGHNLPHDALAREEFEVYVRLYGEPIRMLGTEEVAEIEAAKGNEGVRLLGVDGEEVRMLEEEEEALLEEEGAEQLVQEEGLEDVDVQQEEEQFLRFEPISAELREELEKAGVSIVQHTQAELEALERDEEFDDEQDLDAGKFRTHPLTKLGQFGTRPGTVMIPKSIVDTTLDILDDVPNKHLDQAAEKILGGPGLPKSGLMHRTADQTYRGVGMDTGNVRLSDMEASVHVAAVLPGMYAQCLSALTELRKRLGSEWVLGGDGEYGVKRVLDIGTGGAGVLAWRSVLEAETELRKEEEEERKRTTVERKEVLPEQDESKEAAQDQEASRHRATVVVGSPALRYRMSKFLENTSFIPRLPDEPSPSQPRKPYDLIMATNTLHPLTESYKQKQHIDNLLSLLNPSGGVLLLIEKGTPHGFESIATARDTLLSSPEPPLIVAPCTNSSTCPLFTSGPAEHPRRDFCAFPQRYERPTYLQRILKATARNHDDLTFSYVSIRAGRTRNPAPSIDPDAFTVSSTPVESPYPMSALRNHAYTLPRTIFKPMKRRGHVIMDVCTPEAKIERWTVPRSFSRTAYRDARKARWGDLWALGAKTQISRNLKLGNERVARGGVRLKQETVLDAEKDDVRILEREVDRKGGKKRNPGKRERERRNQRKEAAKARAAMKEGLEGVEKFLEKKLAK